MRLSIIPSDQAVYVDGASQLGLDLSFIPSNIHALQWYETHGELEFVKEMVDGQFVYSNNQPINELPDWANQAKVKFDEAVLAQQQALELAILEAQNNPVQTTGTEEF
jgi:hypothetical protein